jgi:AGZA family xanthine/uracil permease-like MFS transporter
MSEREPDPELADIGGSHEGQEGGREDVGDAEPAEGEGGPGVPVYTSRFAIWLDGFFEIRKRRSTITTEVLAGMTSFLAMVYVLIVNPQELCSGEGFDTYGAQRRPSVFIATCFGSLFGCLLMAVLAKMPYCQAPGMGINTALGSLIAVGDGAGHVWTFENAMALVLIYSLIVMVVTILPVGRNPDTGKLIPFRSKLFDSIPRPVRDAIPAGMGFFITLIGVRGSGIISSNPFVLIQLADFTKLFATDADNEIAQRHAAAAVVCFLSLFTVAILTYYDIRGAAVIGIAVGTLLGIPLKVSHWRVLAGRQVASWKFWENFDNYFAWDSEKGGIFFSCFRGFNFPSGSAVAVVMHIVTLGTVDLFETMGTVVGLSANSAELHDEDGKPRKYGRIMVADSLASILSSLLGTSSVTTYVESGTGVAVGGRTGLCSMISVIGYLLAIFLRPLFAFIPLAAASSVMLYMGVLMMTTISLVDFQDVRELIIAFLTMTMMPFTYSITKGIGLGILSYVLVYAIGWVVDIIVWLVKKRKLDLPRPPWPLSIITVLVAALFAVYFFAPFA